MDNRRNNKFYEEEVDDDEFLRHPKSGTSGYLLPGAQGQPNTSTKPTIQPNNAFNQQAKNSQNQDLEKQRQLLIDRRREIEERTLASSERGLGLLYESEKVGVATADELSRQKEQLMRTEQRLDDINSTLRNSEKHIQGIRSVFGAVRNYFGGDTSLSRRGPVLMPIQFEDLHYPRESLLPLYQFDRISLFRQIHWSPTSRNCWSHEAGSTAKCRSCTCQFCWLDWSSATATVSKISRNPPWSPKQAWFCSSPSSKRGRCSG